MPGDCSGPKLTEKSETGPDSATGCADDQLPGTADYWREGLRAATAKSDS
jgi:hypothetical protein